MLCYSSLRTVRLVVSDWNVYEEVQCPYEWRTIPLVLDVLIIVNHQIPSFHCEPSTSKHLHVAWMREHLKCIRRTFQLLHVNAILQLLFHWDAPIRINHVIQKIESIRIIISYILSGSLVWSKSNDAHIVLSTWCDTDELRTFDKTWNFAMRFDFSVKLFVDGQHISVSKSREKT